MFLGSITLLPVRDLERRGFSCVWNGRSARVCGGTLHQSCCLCFSVCWLYAEKFYHFTGYSLMWSCAVGCRAEQRWPKDSHDPASFSELQSSSNHSAALLEPASLPVWEQLWKQLQILLGGFCPCVKQHVILTAAFKPFDLWCFCCWLITFCSLLHSCHPPLSLLSAATAEQG